MALSPKYNNEIAPAYQLPEASSRSRASSARDSPVLSGSQTPLAFFSRKPAQHLLGWFQWPINGRRGYFFSRPAWKKKRHSRHAPGFCVAYNQARRTLHRAPVGQGPPGPGWLAISFGFWSGRALATGTAKNAHRVASFTGWGRPTGPSGTELAPI